MSYTTEELLQIRRKMESEIALTETTVENFRELTKPISPENAIGRVSRMDAINNKSVNDSALRNAELKLNNLRVALTKIDEKDFGICRICNNIIPVGRILLMPYVITCVNCASRM